MNRIWITGVVGLLLSGPVYGESLPSFKLSLAATISTDIVVVADGKIVEVWKGSYRVGERWPEPVDKMTYEVKPTWHGGDVDILKQQIAARKLKWVTEVTGKRQVLFRVRGEEEDFKEEPVSPELADRKHHRRVLRSDAAYSTIWIESGQAFARQQPHNPGNSFILPIYEMTWNRGSNRYEQVALTEGQLKHEIADYIKFDQEYSAAAAEKDPTRRKIAYFNLLLPEDHDRMEAISSVFDNYRVDVWPLIAPMLKDQKLIAIHAELAHVVYVLAPGQLRPQITQAFEELLAEKLPADADADMIRQDKRRKQRVQGIVDYWEEVAAAEKKPTK